MNKVYNNIYELRKAKGLSQMDLAEKLGINQDSVSKLERGKILLTIERLEQLAGIFGMTVIEILQYGSGVEKPQIVVDTEKVKELENKVLLLEKDLEIRDLKLNRVEKLKKSFCEGFVFAIIHNIINHFDFRKPIDKDYFERKISRADYKYMIDKDGCIELLKEMNNEYTKEFFISSFDDFNDYTIEVNFDDIDASFEFNELSELFPINEIIEYFAWYYDTFKVVINLDNRYKPNMKPEDAYWRTVRRNKNDKYFLELIYNENK